eukprot:423098-Prorocentrum_minimum.AAC.4
MGGQQAVPGAGNGALVGPPGAAGATGGYAAQHSAAQQADARVTAAQAAAAMGMPGGGGAGAPYRPQVPQGGYAFPGYGGLPASTLAAAAANFGQPQGAPKPDDAPSALLS